ncbi:hypothetical protein NE237_032893 [Protea cynaroides]|uniref:Uncharacterized protein n=1 Tax=Protea cynaroides TaxID=273540 RepID=A0A9Q0L5J4_9MAGN|nr:hypothetical protein NE237_032893 [Protea cynaroides]
MELLFIDEEIVFEQGGGKLREPVSVSKESLMALHVEAVSKNMTMSKGKGKARTFAHAAQEEIVGLLGLPLAIPKPTETGPDSIPESAKEAATNATVDDSKIVLKTGLQGPLLLKRRGDEDLFRLDWPIVSCYTMIGDPLVGSELIAG